VSRKKYGHDNNQVHPEVVKTERIVHPRRLLLTRKESIAIKKKKEKKGNRELANNTAWGVKRGGGESGAELFFKSVGKEVGQ